MDKTSARFFQNSPIYKNQAKGIPSKWCVLTNLLVIFINYDIFNEISTNFKIYIHVLITVKKMFMFRQAQYKVRKYWLHV